MPPQMSELGQLVKDHLFFLGKTETKLAEEMGLSLNKLSAAMHGRYSLTRHNFERMVAILNVPDEDRREWRRAWERDRKKRPMATRLTDEVYRAVHELHTMVLPDFALRRLHEHIKEHSMAGVTGNKVSAGSDSASTRPSTESESPCTRGQCPFVSRMFPVRTPGRHPEVTE